MIESLVDKKVVIVGGSSGMGLAVGQMAAKAGAHVVLASRSQEKLEQARKKIDGRSDIVAVDMLDENSVGQMFEQVGDFDHLLLTAVADETKLSGKIAELSTEVAQKSLQKIWGAFYIVRAAVPHIRSTGSITLTSSVAIFSPPANGGSAMQNAASAAVAAFGRSLAAELKPIRVNVLVPGIVNTAVHDSPGSDEREQLKQWAEKTLPVKHLAEPEELADAILFLMTNPYATGTLLTVDGGLMLT